MLVVFITLTFYTNHFYSITCILASLHGDVCEHTLRKKYINYLVEVESTQYMLN